MRTVFLIEDDLGIRDALQEILQAENYRVLVADHGRDALDRFPALPRPDLILLDLSMPVMTGWQFLQEIEGKNEFTGIPIAVFSAASHPENLPKSIDVIRKPVDLDALLQLVEKHCS